MTFHKRGEILIVPHWGRLKLYTQKRGGTSNNGFCIELEIAIEKIEILGAIFELRTS